MYSEAVVDRTLHELAQQGHKFQARSVDESLSVTERLTKVFNGGKWKRQLSESEAAFIKSEILLCKHDFRYFLRYAYTELDASEGGGVGPAQLWQSQERALEIIAKREDECLLEIDKHGFTQGIRGVWHKTRQQGATSLLRLITAQRMCLYRHTRALAASLDQDKIHELYKRDHIWLDNLPFFLIPKIQYDTKAQQIYFENLKSGIIYQQANQQAGVGTGQQFDMSHITEVALWPLAERLEFDLLPAIPQARSTFFGMESTANGRDNFWCEFTENVRHRREGFSQWIYSFTPWYINSKKNRLPAPDDWRPNEITQQHADLIERTSSEFAGTTIRPHVNNLYWWETEYLKNKEMGSLAVFFSNYPATPEQSFQYSAAAALPIETIEWMRANSINGMPYELSCGI